MNRITNKAAILAAGHRQHDIPEEAQRTGAIHARGLYELVRDRHEDLAKQQRGGRRGDERQPKTGEGIDQSEIRT